MLLQLANDHLNHLILFYYRNWFLKIPGPDENVLKYLDSEAKIFVFLLLHRAQHNRFAMKLSLCDLKFRLSALIQGV